MQTPTNLNPDENDYTNLAIAVLKSGCQPRNRRYPRSKGGEGVGYLDTDDGQFWMGLIDIDPASMKRLITLHPDWEVEVEIEEAA